MLPEIALWPQAPSKEIPPAIDTLTGETHVNNTSVDDDARLGHHRGEIGRKNDGGR